MNKTPKNQKPDFEEVCDKLKLAVVNAVVHTDDGVKCRVVIPGIGDIQTRKHDDGEITVEVHLGLSDIVVDDLIDLLNKASDSIKKEKGKKNESE